MKVCLIHLDKNMYEVVDCQTEKSINLNKIKSSKRKPSKYNLHMKECLKSKSGPIQPRFKTCANEWKRKK